MNTVEPVPEDQSVPLGELMATYPENQGAVLALMHHATAWVYLQGHHDWIKPCFAASFTEPAYTDPARYADTNWNQPTGLVGARIDWRQAIQVAGDRALEADLADLELNRHYGFLRLLAATAGRNIEETRGPLAGMQAGSYGARLTYAAYTYTRADLFTTWPDGVSNATIGRRAGFDLEAEAYRRFPTWDAYRFGHQPQLGDVVALTNTFHGDWDDTPGVVTDINSDGHLFVSSTNTWFNRYFDPADVHLFSPRVVDILAHYLADPRADLDYLDPDRTELRQATIDRLGFTPGLLGHGPNQGADRALWERSYGTISHLRDLFDQASGLYSARYTQSDPTQTIQSHLAQVAPSL